MAEANKDTIYIDVDDEITAIIDKVKDSSNKIVALVLPKRSTVLQSIVNMKLLKKTAAKESKKVVLITSEASLLPIAGAVGLYVAKTLQSKPVIPAPPELPPDQETLVDDEEPVDELDKSKSIGELAGLPAAAELAKSVPDEETIDIDTPDEEDTKAADKPKAKKNKIKVPNFDKFRLRLLLGAAGLILLIVFLVFATKVWPKAVVTIKTNAISVNTNFSFTADTSAQSVDETKNIVPAVAKDEVVTNSQKVTATGQKNVGDAATGTVTMSTTTNCITPVGTVPAGTTVSASNLNFTTGDAANFSPTGVQNGKCIWSSNSVSVTAQSGGSNYNLAAQPYTVSGYPSVSAQGSTMTGGTDKTVTVVQQSDIDGAVEKITQNTDQAKKDLSKQLQDAGLFPLTATVVAGKQTISSDSKVGDQASDVTVTGQTDFTMLGVKRDDLKKLVIDAAKSQIDTKAQTISDDGLDQAQFAVTTHQSPTNQTLSVQTTASAGAQIDVSGLKKQIAGKKQGDVKQLIQELPSVQDVSIKLSPFWVSKVPTNTGKISIVVQKNQASSSNGSSSP